MATPLGVADARFSNMNLMRTRPAGIVLCYCGACRRGISARVPCSPSEVSRRQKGAILFEKHHPYMLKFFPADKGRIVTLTSGGPPCQSDHGTSSAIIFDLY